MKIIRKITAEILAGTTIGQASREAQELADHAGVRVEFAFNGVTCVATPNGNCELLAERQQVAQNKPKTVDSI